MIRTLTAPSTGDHSQHRARHKKTKKNLFTQVENTQVAITMSSHFQNYQTEYENMYVKKGNKFFYVMGMSQNDIPNSFFSLSPAYQMTFLNECRITKVRLEKQCVIIQLFFLCPFFLFCCLLDCSSSYEFVKNIAL